MPLRDAAHELGLLVRSRHPLLVLDSTDDERLRTLLHHVTDAVGVPLFTWSRVRGLTRAGASAAVYGTDDPGAALGHVSASTVTALYHFPGLAPLLRGNAALEARFQEAVARARAHRSTLVVTGPDVDLPEAVTPHITRFQMPAPSEAELRGLLSQLIRDLSARQHVEVAVTPAELTRLLRPLEGLTLLEAEKILTKAIVEDGRLGVEDIRHVIDAKKQVIEREGLLEYYPLEEAQTEIADLVRLKDWLRKRKAVLQDPAAAQRFGLEFPRGMLLLGVPGCGKSLCAKAVAAEWQLPLLKLDPSNLYNKYIGESEKNFKRAMEAAERMAPVVLWIDELEKAFAEGGSEDGGVSTRILGSFLSWMQERKGEVFVVATANQIARVPPELLRKGRFDEIFFVDLPPAEVRRDILRIHLAKRGHDPAGFDLDGLAARSDGFSGAELEQVVVAALFSAFSARQPLTDGGLHAEIDGTLPLSVTMAERVAEMRAWARDRAVPAN
ncbi:MAG: AAA family ATPase [Gemmatimonadota bacterium]